MKDSPEHLAQRLDQAMLTRVPIAPLSETEALADVADAWAIQSAWTHLRVARGEEIVGRKVGLTNPALQKQMGIHEPDYGNLWARTHYFSKHGEVEIPVKDFVQPRIEGE